MRRKVGRRRRIRRGWRTAVAVTRSMSSSRHGGSGAEAVLTQRAVARQQEERRNGEVRRQPRNKIEREINGVRYAVRLLGEKSVRSTTSSILPVQPEQQQTVLTVNQILGVTRNVSVQESAMTMRRQRGRC